MYVKSVHKYMLLICLWKIAFQLFFFSYVFFFISRSPHSQRIKILVAQMIFGTTDYYQLANNLNKSPNNVPSKKEPKLSTLAFGSRLSTLNPPQRDPKVYFVFFFSETASLNFSPTKNLYRWLACNVEHHTWRLATKSQCLCQHHIE